MTTSYVLCPGWVRSRTDGDAHFIGAMMDERVKLGLPALPTKEHP